ncbi:MAG: 2-amino-4-hydroxy-6-hydroxymethyldihydropteridine diphosphokinase [Coprothermobacterota bacterium]|nr:2-amino-4-hydroxy-6-hydroxymethyldihydropteridine diphosphokinase [Coprothermobacterota bacterium]
MRIVLEGFPLQAFLGCLEEEQQRRQSIVVDLSLFLPPPASDWLEQTVDYRAVLGQLQALVASRHWNLIETLCQAVALDLLHCFPRLLAVRVRLHKPEAPLGVPFADLYAEITLGRPGEDGCRGENERERRTTAWIGLGSNLGDRREMLRRAVHACRSLGAVEACSSLYQTEPVGFQEQPPFLNAALRLRTDLTARALLKGMKAIEADLGRRGDACVAPTRWGPRTIDLDLLFYGHQVINEEGLVVPHPQLHRRGFVLFPLLELASAFFHPVLHRTVLDLWLEWPETEGVQWVEGPGWAEKKPTLPVYYLPADADRETIRAKLARHGVPANLMGTDLSLSPLSSVCPH